MACHQHQKTTTRMFEESGGGVRGSYESKGQSQTALRYVRRLTTTMVTQGAAERCEGSGQKRLHMAMGQNPNRTPSEHPIQTPLK